MAKKSKSSSSSASKQSSAKKASKTAKPIGGGAKPSAKPAPSKAGSAKPTTQKGPAAKSLKATAEKSKGIAAGNKGKAGKAESKSASSAPSAKAKSVQEVSKPALMTARGKVKDEVDSTPKVSPTSSNKKLLSKKGTAIIRHVEKVSDSEPVNPADYDNDGDQLIAMAKQEMSKINKTGESEKAEKPGKFKPIKIERGNLADEKSKWQELYKRYGKEKAVAYKMTDAFEALRPIQHKVLGWGFILSSENNRLEVLFENGIKMLISNYKPT